MKACGVVFCAIIIVTISVDVNVCQNQTESAKNCIKVLKIMAK